MSDTDQTSAEQSSIVPWDTLDRWSATAFLVAGAFFVGFVVRNGVIAFGDGFSETVTAGLYVAFVVPAELAAYVGLLGLYPRLSDRVPRLAGAGTVLVGIAGVAILGFAAGVGSALLAAGAPDPPAVTQLLWLVTLVTTILGFIVFGVGSLRAGVSPPAGLLLLVPPATYVVMMAGTIVGYTPEWSTLALSAVQAGVHLAIGVALRNGDGPAGRTEATLDSTA